jgi:hypothetical protein
MESKAIETSRERPAAEHEEQQSDALLFSDTGQSICYWGAMVLLAVASAYLIHSQFTHPSVYARPASDPLGIVTPPWLILPLAPLGAVGSLGHALWQALRGRQRWKWLLASAACAFVLAAGEVLATCA